MWTSLRNKVYLKKSLKYCFIVIIIFVLMFILIEWNTYSTYTKNYNRTIANLLQQVREAYPKADMTQLVEILNQENVVTAEIDSILLEYGIDMEKDSLIMSNNGVWKKSTVTMAFATIVFAFALIYIFLAYNHKKDKEIAEITYYVEQINRRNYKLEMESVSEDELSILKAEIYKTTVMLKEVAENALVGKQALKDALSDISHQIKTPLTSLLIMLENMEEHPEMERDVQQFYIRSMKREIQNINFLIQSLLKLSKLEADVVTFANEEIDVRQLVYAAIQNVSILSDLKNVDIKVNETKGKIYCDFRWQVEAITNVLKNCIEYSSENGDVIIEIRNNPVYTSISIQDFGPGMSKEEQKHIFDRFYNGKNVSPESIGIGLALAKTIIEANNGKISVESDENRTKFVVKYLK